MKNILNAVCGVVESLISENVKTAIKYLDEKTAVKGTVRGKHNARNKHMEILLSIGVPNYKERKFIKLWKRYNEKFPVKKIQLKFYPKKRK